MLYNNRMIILKEQFMELVKVGEKTYYIKNPTNIGIYKIDETQVYLIDTGNDKEAGKKILKIIDEQGQKVKDNVYFLADSLFSEETITKYHLFFIYDVREFLNTLDYLNTLNGNMYIPSHCEATNNISSLIELNKNKVKEIIDKIYNICEKEMGFEEILKYIFDEYNLTMNANQYVLVGSTIRSYLSYLLDENKISYEFKDNKMLWKQA